MQITTYIPMSFQTAWGNPWRLKRNSKATEHNAWEKHITMMTTSLSTFCYKKLQNYEPLLF